MSMFNETMALTQEMEWTNEQVIRLLQEYRNRPILWDSHHDMYRVQTAKYDAWSQMARIFQCEIADLRKKFNSIFASHRREKIKVRHGARTTWFLYNYMSFLPNHIDNLDESILSTKDPSKNDESEENSEASHGNIHHEVITIKEEPMELPPEKAKLLHKKPRLKRVIKKTARELIPKRLERSLPELSVKYVAPNGPKKKDECDSFGEYIAVSLRKHDDRTRSMIKQAINNILFEQEMKKYNNSFNVVMTEVENPLIIGDDEGCDDEK